MKAGTDEGGRGHSDKRWQSFQAEISRAAARVTSRRCLHIILCESIGLGEEGCTHKTSGASCFRVKL